MRSYSLVEVPPKVFCDCSADPGRTKQSFRDEADINVLMKRYEKTGRLVDPYVVGRRQAVFGDFGDGLDFMDAHQRVQDARKAFQTLPARVRDRFGNDPAELLMFLADPANAAEAVELGLRMKRPDRKDSAEEGSPKGSSTKASGPEPKA